MKLQFKNGNFRIMQIADIQDTNKTSKATVELIRRALDEAKPDLVVFTGDQIKGYGINLLLGDRKKNVAAAISNILKPLEERNIPFTFVFGNHDDTSFSISKQEQYEIYKSHKNCLAFNADDGIEGYCNHNLPVYGSDGKMKLNLYMLDSLSMNIDNSCPPVSDSQLEWYRKTREELKNDNGGYVPSMLFQHIPVPEIYNLLMTVKKGTPGSTPGYRGEYKGKFLALNPEYCAVDGRSFLGERPCTPYVKGQFDVMSEKGDVFAMFFGHDHNNSFAGSYKGIKMGYCQGCGFNIYGPADRRGVRVFDIPEDNPKDFTTYTITARDYPDFDKGNKLKYIIYTYAPSSLDMAKPLIAKGVAVLAALAAAGVGLYFLLR